MLYVHTVATWLHTNYLCILILDEVPELSDLNKIIVPKYTARWKDLGIELKILLYYLEAIEVDYVHYKSYNEQCCRAMLQKWMQMTPKPTWNKLNKAINNLPLLSHDGNTKSKKRFTSFIKYYRVYTTKVKCILLLCYIFQVSYVATRLL